MIDRIEIFKSRRSMLVYEQDRLVRKYRIALGKQPVGPKRFEGDLKTPEGSYLINGRNSQSKFYKNLGISYPDALDVAYAERHGKSAGGDIKIHGIRNGQGWKGRFHRLRDWTAGCIAVTNREMDELFAEVADGAVVNIHP